MSLDREARVLSRHAFAVVFHSNQLLAAQLDGNPDPGRARIDSVLDQLLDDRRRPLDDLAGRDLIRQIIGKPYDSPQSRFLRTIADCRTRVANLLNTQY